jgi:predicted transcriptional regulator
MDCRERVVADNLKELTVSIVGRYVEVNTIGAADLPSLIRSTYAALREASQPASTDTDAVAKPTAAKIRKSITPDALISFIDGKPYKMLRRHLTTQGLTPNVYRERYGLPWNYPVTAPNYSAARSALARKAGLGRKATRDPATPTPTPKPALSKAEGAAKAAPKAGPGARAPKAVRSSKANNTAPDALVLRKSPLAG